MKKRPYSTFPSILAAAALATTASVFSPFAQAAPVAWDAGGGLDTNWHIAPTSLNWDTDADPTSGDDVTFTATGAAASGVTNTVNQDFTINSLTYSINSNSLVHTTSIDPGVTLAISGGNLAVGPAPTSNNTDVVITGAGTFTVTNTGGSINVGSGNNGKTASLDMSGLGIFKADLGSGGTFRIGDNLGGGSGQSTSIVTLAATSTITAGKVGVGDAGTGGATHQLKLGSGVNTIETNDLSVGPSANSNSAKGKGSLTFNGGTGSLILRDATGGTTGALNMVNTNSNSSATLVSTVDFTGHSADISVANLNMGLRSATSNASGSTSTLSFDTGTLAAATVTMGRTSFTGTANSIINIGGGTANLGTINMAQATNSGGTANATINLTGGTTTVTGNIVKTGGTGTSNASVAISGGTLISSGTTKTTGANVTLSSGLLDLNLGSTGSLQFVAPTSGSTTGSNFLMSGGTLHLTIAGLADFDQLLGGGATAGTFEITTGVLDLTGSTLTAGTYNIFSGFNASSTGGNFASITGYNTGAFNAVFASSGGTGTLTVSAVPEPSTFAMLLGGFGMLVGMQRSRRRTR